MLNRNRLMILAAPLALAACDNADTKTDMPMQTEDMLTAEEMPMGTQDMPMAHGGSAVKTGSAEGTVTAIDAAGGTITVEHGAVPSVSWPAMTMPFGADEAQRGKVAVGDNVVFTFSTSNEGNVLNSISKK